MLILKTFLSFCLFFSSSFLFAQTKVKLERFKKAEAVRPEVEIFAENNFDSEILTTINPGRKYFISNKKFGPFYKMKISDQIVGFVADTEIDIEGVGRVQEKAFIDDLDRDKDERKKLPKIKDETEDEPEIKENLNGLYLHLINYNEKTMGKLQVSDVMAIGYRAVPYLSEFASTTSWEINVAWKAPNYYEKELNAAATGGIAWIGAQFMNLSAFGSSKSLHYGLGPFLKYSNFQIKSSQKEYALQDLTVGLFAEAGLLIHFNFASIDFGIRLNWDKSPYGGLNIGVLF